MVVAALAGCSGGSGGGPAPVVSGGAGNPPPAGDPPFAQRERWTPTVIPETQTEPVLFEVVATGKASAATLKIGAEALSLRDDGTGGDKRAGDGIWTVRIPAAKILERNKPQWVNRPYIGALTLEPAPTTYNVYAEVWTADIGLRPVYPVDNGGQETDYVVNYVATFDQLERVDTAHWARRFYATHPDQFDFLNFVMVAGGRGNRYHSLVKNTVSGIGAPLLDNTAGFGSKGRLLGTNVFPLSPLYDLGSVGFLHETGHQWISYLPTIPFGPANPHWPKGSVAINVMGFSMPPTRQGGDYLYSFTPDGKDGYVTGAANPDDKTTFSMLELYLMGLARADEVPEYFTLKDQQREIVPGTVLKASDIDPVRVADIVAAVGLRNPGAADSQKAFRSATIILSEQPLDARAMALYDYFARRGEAREVLPCVLGWEAATCKPWYLATRGRSTMGTKIR